MIKNCLEAGEWKPIVPVTGASARSDRAAHQRHYRHHDSYVYTDRSEAEDVLFRIFFRDGDDTRYSEAIFASPVKVRGDDRLVMEGRTLSSIRIGVGGVYYPAMLCAYPEGYPGAQGEVWVNVHNIVKVFG